MKRTILTATLISICFFAYPNRLKHISTHNGLSNKRTFSIAKDTKGFIWISTRMGIDRYDGNNIKQYTLVDKTGSNDLIGRINILVKDKSDNIWTFTNFGQIFRYDELSDSYILKLNLRNEFPAVSLFLTGILFIDDERMMVFGSFGIWIYNLSKKTFQPVEEFKNVYTFTAEYIGNDTFTVSNDEGTYITSINFKNNRIIKEKTVNIGVHERVNVIYYESSDSTLLVGTFSGKLLQYDIKKSLLKKLDFDFKTSVRDIKCYNNIIYVAVNGVGLVTINRDSKQKQETYASSFLNNVNLPSYFFYSILLDDNRLWIATNSDGVYLLDENLPDFQTISYELQKQKNKTNLLNSFLEDSNGNMWFATSDGVFQYDITKKKWTHLLNNEILNNTTPRYNALILCEDNEGNIWVGGESFGIASCINKKTFKITENSYFNVDIDVKGAPVNGRIYSIFKDSEGNIWLGGLHGWLTKFNPTNKQVKRYDVKSVTMITECNSVILVGTVRGLYVQHKNEDSFTHLLTTERLQSEMLSYINVLYGEPNGIIWLGSEGGLLKYNRNTDELKIYTKADGLLSDAIFGILPDERGRVWLSSEKGLACLNPQEDDFIYFGVEEGLSDERFSLRNQFLLKNGELLFGYDNGAVSFFPEKIDHLKIHNHLVITDFSINYQPIHPAFHQNILKKIIDETSHLKLKYNQNTFSFGFTSINFTNSHRTRFEWMLEGYDKDWIKGIDVRNVYYTNVPPGEYTFRLRSINSNDGSETDQKTLFIEITPPIWATVWAKILYILILLILSWIIFQFIKERLEKRSSSEKIRFFTHTAHELKTPVALIKGPLNKLQEKEHLSKEGKVLLNLVEKNTERLNNLVLQLLDFQKTEMSNVKLYVSEKELTSYVREKLEVFRELVEEKNIKLSLILNTEAVNVWFDEDQMDKILNNLLSNAFKYTPRNGEIKVTVSLDKNHWLLEVRDNGIGIPEKLQKEIFKPFYRADNVVNSTETGSGIGLLLTLNLVKLHHGTISFDSAEGIGTVFSLRFPIGKRHFNKNKIVFMEKKMKDIEPMRINSDKKLSILIVEDNDELRYFLKQCLTEKYIVHEAINGNEGMKLAKIVLPEMILSDVMMPEMNGYELCKQIKENKETSHIPVILMTALDDKSNVLKGYELGADNYVTKPFDANILILTIENTISTREALRRNLMLPLEKEISNETELDTNELDKAFLDEVMSIIDKNISDSEYAINDLCREAAMSRTSFYNKMKILTNQSPNSFIRLVRLNRAAKLLKGGNNSITEVASLTGFGDVKYFSTTFKKHFGISPKKYGKS